MLLKTYELQGYTFSQIVRMLNGKYPESTIKVVLKRLKNFGLMEFGDNKNKGKPLNLTRLGEKFCEILGGE